MPDRSLDRPETPMLGSRAARRAFFPLALVAISLASLALIPPLMVKRADAVRARFITVESPAHALITQFQSDFAVQLAAAWAHAIAGNEHAREDYQRMRVATAAAIAQLQSLATTIGPSMPAAVTALAGDLRSSHGSMDSLFAGTISRTKYITQLDDHRQQFHRVFADVATVNSSLSHERIIVRTNQRDAERRARIVSLGLILLSFISALFVANLGFHYWRLSSRLRTQEEQFRQMIRGFTHDVKNPLAAADGYLALLDARVGGSLTDEQAESVAGTRRSIRLALGLIQNLLELERAESGEVKIERVPVDATRLVSEVTDDFRAKARASGLTLSVDSAPDETLMVETDHERVRQILGNLLSNAIKYTPSGGTVVVGASAKIGTAAPEAGEWAALTVRDTGMGISAEHQQLLFHEFTRINALATEGAGIGLASSQRIAQALDARITVQSEPMVGSTFTLWLPRRPRSAASTVDGHGASLPSRNAALNPE